MMAGVVVVDSMQHGVARTAVTALANTGVEVVEAGDTQAVPRGGVLLSGGIVDQSGLAAVAERARAAARALVLFDPPPLAGWQLGVHGVVGVVVTRGTAVSDLVMHPEQLPWLRMARPLDERRLLAARRCRPQHRAALQGHLRLAAEVPWLLGPGPGTAPDTWQMLARIAGRAVDLPWCLIVTPAAGDGAAQAAAALRSLPEARVRIWPSPADTDRMALLVGCDLCLWPGTDEADVDLLLTAQAAGMPVIASRGAASAECVRDGLTGRVLPAGNPESMANGLRFLLRQPAFLSSMGRQASEIILGDHTLVPTGRTLGRFLSRWLERDEGSVP